MRRHDHPPAPLSIRGVVLLLLLLAVSLPARSQEEPSGDRREALQLFTEANEKFNSGKSEGSLREAADIYARLIRKGHETAHLHYNLGNTYLRLQETGRAILHFQRALRRDPGHEYARAMLDLAREEVADRFVEEEEASFLRTLFFWHFEGSTRARTTGLLLAWCLIWSLLMLRLFTRPPLFRTLLGAGLIVLAATGGSLAIENLARRGTPGVLVAPSTEVRRGHGSSYDLVFESPVLDGVEVEVLETRNLWKQVRFPGGVIGWVPSSAVAEY